MNTEYLKCNIIFYTKNSFWNLNDIIQYSVSCPFEICVIVHANAFNITDISRKYDIVIVFLVEY